MSVTMSNPLTATRTGLPSHLFVEPVDASLLCFLCNQVLRDATVISGCPCHTIYCRNCIVDRLAIDLKCPKMTCGREVMLSDVAPIVFLDTQIQRFRVKCHNNSDLCSASSELGPALRFWVLHDLDCAFTPIQCNFCQQMFPRNLFDRHNQFDCPFRLLSCNECNEPNIKACEMEQHLKICPQFEVNRLRMDYKQMQNRFDDMFVQIKDLKQSLHRETVLVTSLEVQNATQQRLIDELHNEVELLKRDRNEMRIEFGKMSFELRQVTTKQNDDTRLLYTTIESVSAKQTNENLHHQKNLQRLETNVDAHVKSINSNIADVSNQIRTEVADRIENNRIVDSTFQAMNKRHDESEAQLRDLEFEKSVSKTRTVQIVRDAEEKMRVATEKIEQLRMTLDKARVVDNQRLDAVCGTFEQQQSAFRQETIHLRLELARVADLASSPSVAVPPIVSQPLVVAAIPFDFKSNRESNVADVPSVNSTAPKSSGLSSSISFELRQLRADLDESMSKFADERRQQHQSLCQLVRSDCAAIDERVRRCERLVGIALQSNAVESCELVTVDDIDHAKSA